MSKHTIDEWRTPWSVETALSHHNEWYTDVLDKTRVPIIEDLPKEEYAHLIAAAPDMLKLCRELLDYVRLVKTVSPHIVVPGGMVDAEAYEQALEGVIAKADGRTAGVEND